jgi:LysR family transcriptional activator of nhaA
VVAREGSIARATRVLRLAQPTISAQIRLLEDRLGEKLFERRGRGLVPTEAGRLAYRYADEIFGLGRELLEVVHGRAPGRLRRFAVGIVDAVPKLVAHRLLAPAFAARAEGLRIVCHEDHAEPLLARLALHELDLGRFPRSLDGAPALLPTENTALRRALDAWFEARGLRPRVAGEFEDSALLKVFGQRGAGLFFGPSAIEGEIARQYGVRRVGRLPEVRERFYAISAERRLSHPAVKTITETARSELFGP